MKRGTLYALALIVSVGLIAVVGSVATAGSSNTDGTKADASKDAKPCCQSEAKLASGCTDKKSACGLSETDMKACMAAGAPGKMHEQLAKEAGVWYGKTTIWMGPDAEPAKGECVATVTPIMEGRFVKWDMAGQIPAMGAYTGLGLYGFDNVSQKLTSAWIDNRGTGISTGEGEQSSDGRTRTWKFTANCPVAKKAVTFREVETLTSPDAKTVETFITDPKSGKEFRMMALELTRNRSVMTAEGPAASTGERVQTASK